jgi:hypothetical protein
MPARDLYHDVVKSALIAVGWTITHDPMVLTWGAKDQFIDLGTRSLLAAEKLGEKIAVAVRSFSGPSDMDDLYQAVGQFILYQGILEESESDRRLYLAVPRAIADDLFQEPIGQILLKNERVRLIAFDPDLGVIVRWIPH